MVMECRNNGILISALVAGAVILISAALSIDTIGKHLLISAIGLIFLALIFIVLKLPQKHNNTSLPPSILQPEIMPEFDLRAVHAQKMHAVGQLAGGIAHDFNNLLTAMIGFCDLLLTRHPPGDPSFADIMQVKQNANRAANLVRQLLAFSRKQTLQPEILDLTEILTELSHLIRRLIGENIEFNLQCDKDLWKIKADHGQLEQVIINLAVNSRDAMHGGGKLDIKADNITLADNYRPDRNTFTASDEHMEAGDYVRLEIEDNGHGMSREVMQKIFDPFYTTKELGQGTGLGLSTVFGIIEQSGGHVYVFSREGEGTKFTIFLKRHVAQEGEAKHDKEERENIGDLTGQGTILIVEDEAPVRIFSSRALSNKGYNVLEAESGEKALEVVKEKGDEIDIVITDVVMPGINGPDMIKEAVRQYPDIKVIFISGYGEDEFMKSYGDKREFHFLPKPYSLQQLATKVRQVI